jgi:hypothetical protein
LYGPSLGNCPATDRLFVAIRKSVQREATNVAELLSLQGALDLVRHHQGPIFRTFFSGENFGENSAENFPPKMLGKNKIFRGKNLRKIGPRGQCYDHKFLQFFLIFGEKIGVFLKNQCYDQKFA